MSRQSRVLANDKGNNEIIPRAVQRSTGICLTAEENSGKPQLGDLVFKIFISIKLYKNSLKRLRIRA